MSAQAKTALIAFCTACVFFTGFLFGRSYEMNQQIEERNVERHRERSTLPFVRETDQGVAWQVANARLQKSADDASTALEQLKRALSNFLSTLQTGNSEIQRQLSVMRGILAPLVPKNHQPCLKPDLRDCYKDRKP